MDFADLVVFAVAGYPAALVVVNFADFVFVAGPGTESFDFVLVVILGTCPIAFLVSCCKPTSLIYLSKSMSYHFCRNSPLKC